MSFLALRTKYMYCNNNVCVVGAKKLKRNFFSGIWRILRLKTHTRRTAPTHRKRRSKKRPTPQTKFRRPPEVKRRSNVRFWRTPGNSGSWRVAGTSSFCYQSCHFEICMLYISTDKVKNPKIYCLYLLENIPQKIPLTSQLSPKLSPYPFAKFLIP